MSAPTIESLSTTIGPVGQWVYLAGSNFIENETKVFFGSIECPNVAFYADTSVGIAIPEGASGESVFKVITPDGEFTSDIAFAVGVPTAAPTITSFYHHTDPTINWVYVAGTNFVTEQTVISYGSEAVNACVYSPECCGFAKENSEDVITSITLITPNGSATFSS
jgi:hypothetical protein